MRKEIDAVYRAGIESKFLPKAPSEASRAVLGARRDDGAAPAAEFLRLVRDSAKTALFVTHSIDEALEVGDRIMVLRRPARIAFETRIGEEIAPEQRAGLRAEILKVLGDDETETAAD